MAGSKEEVRGPGCLRFGEIVVDPAAQLLLRGGQPQPLEPKAFAVLMALLERPGELVARDVLLDAVWGHRHVTPGVLTRAIAQLRAALGDDPQSPRYIQTRHALGYRFVGAVSPGEERAGEAPAARPMDAVPLIDSDPVADAAAGAADLPARPGTEPLPWQPKHWLLASLLASVVAAAALAFSLRDRGGGTPQPAEASIAILPFTTLGGDGSDYFAEGLAVEMHDALAGIEGLKVAALLAPAAATGRDADVRALGQRLGVATVLDASVRRDGGRVRISARLADTATGYTLWNRSYDRELSDVFAIQSEIAGEVVHSLLDAMPGQRQALDRRLAPTRNVAAFDAYLKGLQAMRRPVDANSTDDAVRQFQAALASDPGFSLARVRVCMVEAKRHEYRLDPTALAKAEAACSEARRRDPDSRAAWFAEADLARVSGRHAEAVTAFERLVDDSTLGAAALVGLAKTHAAAGNPEQAQA